MRLIPSITASTLFITGQRDTVTHPHVQSLPFQRGLAARGVPTQHLSLMRPHMFPPAKDEVDKYNLDK